MVRKHLVIRIQRCQECGLCFTQPTYRTWVTRNFYDRVYNAGDMTTELPTARELEELRRTAFRGSAKDFGPLLDRLRPMISVEPGRVPEVLEVGCSWGYLLYQLRAHGFRAMGLEIGDRRREYAKRQLGMDVVASWQELPADRHFDLVIANHVLEHVVDLAPLLASIAASLKGGGIFFAGVPNFDFAVHGRRVLPNIGSIHPLGFDADFFRRNLPKHGLEVVGTYGSWSEIPDRPTHTPSVDGINVIARKASA